MELAVEQTSNGNSTVRLGRLTGYDEPIALTFKDQSLPPQRVLDGWLMAALPLAMSTGEPLHIRGTITGAALRNATAYQEAWGNLRPEMYRPVTLTADAVRDGSVWTRRPKAISTYSGGMDGSFTALRNRGEPGRYDIGALLLLDIDVIGNEHRDFARLHERIRPFPESLGLPLRVLHVDRGPLGQVNWHLSHAAEIAGFLHQYAEHFGHGLIASTDPYSHPVPSMGSQPQLDYLLSGSDFGVVHDGAGFSRTQKAELLATNDVVRRVLQVCWQGPDRAENCGVCLKCLLTQLNFAAVGARDLPVFGRLDLDRVRNLRSYSESATVALEILVEYARARGDTSEWVDVLGERVASFRRGENLG